MQSLPGINRHPEGPLNFFSPSLQAPGGTSSSPIGTHVFRSLLRTKLKSHSKSLKEHLHASNVGLGVMNSSRKQSASALRLPKDCLCPMMHVGFPLSSTRAYQVSKSLFLHIRSCRPSKSILRTCHAILEPLPVVPINKKFRVLEPGSVVRNLARSFMPMSAFCHFLPWSIEYRMWFVSSSSSTAISTAPSFPNSYLCAPSRAKVQVRPASSETYRSPSS